MDTHGHGHAAAAGAAGPSHRRALGVALAVSVSILLVEVVGSFAAHSLALLADAGHVLTDAAGLGLALLAAVLVDRPATASRTWGYRRAEVLAAAAQAAGLLTVGIVVLFQAVRRLVHPSPVAAGTMLAFGAVALVGNLVAVAVLLRVRERNLNVRAALLELGSDALGAAAVVVAAVVLAATGWSRADAVASLFIAVLILPRTWRLLRETVDVLLESTPRGIDLTTVREHLLEVEHVRDIHDLHATSVSTDLPVLTAHVVVDDSCFHDGHVPELLDQLQACLAGHFDVSHSTFQFERAAHAAHEHASHS